MKKSIFLLLVMGILLSYNALAVECDADLNVTPCDIHSDLTLNSGIYSISNVSIFIGANNLVFDGNGATLNGSLVSGVRGINIGSNVVGVTVKNLNLQNFDFGIGATNNEHDLVLDNLNFSNNNNAIWLTGAGDNSNITNIIIEGTAGDSKRGMMIDADNILLDNILVSGFTASDLYAVKLTGNTGLTLTNSNFNNYKNVDIRSADSLNMTNGYISNINITGLGLGGGRGLWLYQTEDFLVEDVNINNVDVVSWSGVAFGSDRLINTTVNNLYVSSGYVQLMGATEDSLMMNNLTVDTTNGDSSILFYGGTINNSNLEASTDDAANEYDFCMGGGFSHNDAINKIFNSELSCVDAGEGRAKVFFFDAVTGDNNIDFQLTNVTLTNIDFVFEHFPISLWDDISTTNVSFEFMKLPNYGGDSVLSNPIVLPKGATMDIDLGITISDSITLDGNDAVINGDLFIPVDDITFFDLDVNGIVNISGDGLLAYSNTFRGLVDDNGVGNSFCKYAFSGNFYIGGSYQGVGVALCAEYNEYVFGDGTTNFTGITNWSSVDVVLENDHGKIDWTSNRDLSGTGVDFDAEVKIEKGKITVDSVDYPELNGSASITFKGINANSLSDISVKRDGVACGVKCQSNTYSRETGVFSMDVTSFSTYELDYFETDFAENDITGAVIDTGLKVVVGFGTLAKILGMIVGLSLLGIGYKKRKTIGSWFKK